MFALNKSCLRHSGEPHKTQYMSQNLRNFIFCEKKGSSGSQEDLTKPNAVQKIPGTLVLQQKGACSSCEDFARLYYTILSNIVWSPYVRRLSFIFRHRLLLYA